MSVVRIMSLRLRPAADWASAARRLQARLANCEVDDARLVRIDDERAVLVVSAASSEAMEQLLTTCVRKWFDESSIDDDGDPIAGEEIWQLGGEPARSDEARIDRFVEGVREGGCAWGLRKTTWARSRAAAGREALPMWPDQASARRCIAGEWAQHIPRSIPLAEFLDEWLPGMIEDGIVAVVLPTPDHPGAIVPPDVLLAALRADRA